MLSQPKGRDIVVSAAWAWGLGAAGVAVDLSFILTDRAGQLRRAVPLKGVASGLFAAVGVLGAISDPSGFSATIAAGLVTGALGDVLMACRHLCEGNAKNAFLGTGIVAFALGHVFYLWALLAAGANLLVTALVSAVICIVLWPFFTRRVKAPTKAIGIMGYGYLIVVSTMSAAAIAWALFSPSPRSICLAIGAVTFELSDACMVLNGYSLKPGWPPRPFNLIIYYVAQLLVAASLWLPTA